MPTGGANGNLLQVLHSAGDHTAIILPELELKLSYASLRRQILSISDDLFSAGIRSGDRVAMAMPNGLAAIVSLFAASITGTAVPLNPACPYHECLSLLKHVKARVLLSLSKGWEFARKAAADLGIPVFTVQTGDDGTVRLRDRFEVSSAVPSVCDKIALLLHTSGSTGQPQSIPLPHSNLTISAANIVKTYSLSENDVSLCVMPLFHVHGIVASVLATFLSGGTVVVPTGFNPLAVWRLFTDIKSPGIRVYLRCIRCYFRACDKKSIPALFASFAPAARHFQWRVFIQWRKCLGFPSSKLMG